MTTRIAYEYIGYLIERLVAVGDTEVDALDLTAQVKHFWSSGPCDPIYSTGLGPRYRLAEIELPAWLIAGVEHGQADGRWGEKPAYWYAAAIVLNRTGSLCEWVWAVRQLATIANNSKFYRSLQEWYAEHGCLTDRQAAAVLHPHYR